MSYQTIQYTREGRLARITLNRPASGNAVNALMSAELAEVSSRTNNMRMTSKSLVFMTLAPAAH